jgi:tRNA pseudouridine55 synthase
MGKRKGRALDGILLLDKPRGETSNAALQTVKRLFGARKAGHTGSLDPLAGGLLPVCFGRATKVSGFLLDADKRYWVQARLGEQTTTGDAEGEVIHTTGFAHLGADQVRERLTDFVGEIQQIPPMYSAIKHKGRRLYDLAREGIEVEREPRSIRVYELQFQQMEGATLTLEMHCSKGTYVRTLVEDIATALGTRAHVCNLRRLSVGPFRYQPIFDMAALEDKARQGFEALDATLLPPEAALADWPAVRLDGDSVHYIKRGEPVQVPRAPTSGWVRIHDERENLLGVGQVLEDGRVAPRRMFR